MGGSMALPEFRPDAFEIPPAGGQGPIRLPAPPPHAALNRLPELHEESRLALRRAGLNARAIPAAGALLALGTLTAMFGGGALAPTFAWSLLIFCGVAAVLVSHLRAASVFRDLAGSAADMRAILLYLGLAWGAGAFLALAPGVPALLAFAIIPTLALAWLLADVTAILAFAVPVSLFAAAAMVLRGSSLAGAGLLLALEAGVFAAVLRKRTGLVPL
jgi:hypothetical protein